MTFLENLRKYIIQDAISFIGLTTFGNDSSNDEPFWYSIYTVTCYNHCPFRRVAVVHCCNEGRCCRQLDHVEISAVQRCIVPLVLEQCHKVLALHKSVFPF